MKNKSLIILSLSLLLLNPVAMGDTSAFLTGATACKQNTEYSYRAFLRRDETDKKKSIMEKKLYEWFLHGFAKIQARNDEDTAKGTTVFVGKIEDFPKNPEDWPKGSAQCTIRFKWTSGQTDDQRTSNKIIHTVTPQLWPPQQ